MCRRPRPLGRGALVTIGPERITRQRYRHVGPDFVPSCGAEFEYFQFLAVQIDVVDRLRTLIAAVEHLRMKRIATLVGADHDIFRTHNVRVDLLVTLVPLMQNPVPANVVRAINYYQSPGIWGSPLAADPGFHGKLTNIDVADDPTILHISIDKSARIHSDISREILALSRTKTTAENETWR